MRAELEQELGGLGAEADSRLCSDAGNSTFSLEAYLSKLRQLPYVQVPRHVLVVLVKRPPAQAQVEAVAAVVLAHRLRLLGRLGLLVVLLRHLLVPGKPCVPLELRRRRRDLSWYRSGNIMKTACKGMMMPNSTSNPQKDGCIKQKDRTME
jgi:hypothetical protein